MRVLVTGSRNWSSARAVFRAINDTVFDAGVRPQDVTVVHGNCPAGADKHAKNWSVLSGAAQQAFLADWEHEGKAAGPRRNQRMVDSGADVCLAFPLGESRGTRDCMRRAEAAGIPVRNYGDQP